MYVWLFVYTVHMCAVSIDAHICILYFINYLCMLCAVLWPCRGDFLTWPLRQSFFREWRAMVLKAKLQTFLAQTLAPVFSRCTMLTKGGIARLMRRLVVCPNKQAAHSLGSTPPLTRESPDHPLLRKVNSKNVFHSFCRLQPNPKYLSNISFKKECLFS